MCRAHLTATLTRGDRSGRGSRDRGGGQREGERGEEGAEHAVGHAPILLADRSSCAASRDPDCHAPTATCKRGARARQAPRDDGGR